MSPDHSTVWQRVSEGLVLVDQFESARCVSVFLSALNNKAARGTVKP